MADEINPPVAEAVAETEEAAPAPAVEAPGAAAAAVAAAEDVKAPAKDEASAPATTVADAPVAAAAPAPIAAAAPAPAPAPAPAAVEPKKEESKEEDPKKEEPKEEEEKPKKETEGGVVVFAGGTDWAMIGRQGGAASKKASAEDQALEAERQARYPSLPTPVRLAALDSVPVAFVAAGPCAMHCLAGASDGRLFTWGRNEKGQLGHGDLRQRNVPCAVGGALEGRRAVAAAGGRSHSLVAVEGGDAFAFGSNSQGQLGLGAIRLTSAAAASATAPAGEDLRLSPARSAVAGVSTVAAGADFSAWLNAATGALYTAGCPQYGALGHGTDNEYNARDGSVRLAYAPQPTPRMVAALATVKIRAVACGTAHMLALDDKGGAYTWGNGGYGRLGHTVQRDEHSPRQVAGLTGRTPAALDSPCAAGTTASLCVMAGGQLMAWGKLKVSGENTMYPKPLMDLAGWTVHSLASGGGTFAAAASSVSAPNTANERVERQTVAWGHALNGELGYGAGGKKSSANPDVVPALAGARTLQVAMGTAHSLFLVERGDPAVEALEVWSPDAPDVEEAPPPRASAGASGEADGGGGGGVGGKGVKRKGGGGVAPAAVRGRGRPAGRGRGRGRK